MKFFNFFLFFFLLSVIICKAEKLFVEVVNDTVRIFNTEVNEHCAFTPDIIVNVNDNLIKIIEKDLMTDMTTCVCYFDYFISLTGLQNQEYQVLLYRQYSAPFMNTDSLYFIASTRFTFNNNTGESYSKTVVSNNCYQLNDISEDVSVPEDKLELTSYPNPGNPEITFRYYVPYSGYVSMVIYNINGQLIRQVISQRVGRGEHYFRYDSKLLATGSYICKLLFDYSIIKIHKFTLIK